MLYMQSLLGSSVVNEPGLVALVMALTPPIALRYRNAIVGVRPPEGDASGGAGRDRTGDPLVANQVLSQLSYSPRLRWGPLDAATAVGGPLDAATTVGGRQRQANTLPGAARGNHRLAHTAQSREWWA